MGEDCSFLLCQPHIGVFDQSLQAVTGQSSMIFPNIWTEQFGVKIGILRGIFLMIKEKLRL